MTIEALAGVPANARNKLEFSYDHLGQRIQKTVYTWNVGTASYQLKAVTKLVYYQSSLLAEVDSNNALLRSYTWGRDQILLINEAGNSHAAAYDGTNNLTSLVKTNTGTLSAQYAYDPFGNTLRAIEVFAAGWKDRLSGTSNCGEWHASIGWTVQFSGLGGQSCIPCPIRIKVDETKF